MITTITIEVPAPLTEELGEAAMPRWALEALVLEGVREDILSVGEAGQILGLGYFQAEAFLKEKGVPVLMSDEDFERDQSDLRTIMSLPK